MTESKTGFKTKNEFCLKLEEIKQEQNFETYLETILYYYEHNTDIEMEQLARFLNKKILDSVKYEANQLNMLKHQDDLVSLFS